MTTKEVSLIAKDDGSLWLHIEIDPTTAPVPLGQIDLRMTKPAAQALASSIYLWISTGRLEE